MKPLKLFLILTSALLALSTTQLSLAEEIPCISYEEVFSQSQAHPACGPEFLPDLPFGWTWVKVYRISMNEAESEEWYWLSWPNGKDLTACKEGQPSP